MKSPTRAVGRPRSPDPMNSAHIRAPLWLMERVDEIARRRGTSRARVVIDAVKKQLGIEEPNVFDTPGILEGMRERPKNAQPAAPGSTIKWFNPKG